MADFVGVPSYAPYAGQIKITGNTLDCQPDGMNCLILATTDPVVTGNQINATGSAVGIKVEGALPQAALIQNNTISIQSGQGIVVNSPQTDDSVIESNTISGSSAVSGIWIALTGGPQRRRRSDFGKYDHGIQDADLYRSQPASRHHPKMSAMWAPP